MHYLRFQFCGLDQDSTLIPNYADGCRSFFKCSAGMPFPVACGNNLRFNEKTNYCDWDYNVQCERSGSAVQSSNDDKFHLPVN